MSEFPSCTVRSLPDHQTVEAAKTAIAINPANRPPIRGLVAITLDLAPTVERIAVLTSKYWGAAGVNLTVGFLDGAEPALQSRILSHMNAWSKRANIRFRLTSTDPQVRIARTSGEGYWSYLGTDILHVADDEPTMVLDSFTMQTPDSEFFRVVRHETGHTLGSPHEHMRKDIVALIDTQKAIRYFHATQGWSRQEIMQQVLTAEDPADFLMATPQAEQDSIMCYQLPGSIMKNGKPVPGGVDITDDDYDLMGLLYPVQVA